MSTNERLAAIERTLRALGGNSALPGVPEPVLEHTPSCRLQPWEWELMDYDKLNQLLVYFPGIATMRYDPAPLSDGSFNFPQAVTKPDNRHRDAYTRFSNVLRAAHTVMAKITPDANGRIAYADFGRAMEAIFRLTLDGLAFLEKQRSDMLHAHYGTSAVPTGEPDVAPIGSAPAIFDQLEARAALQQRAQALTGGGGNKKSKNKNKKKKRVGTGNQQDAMPAAQQQQVSDPQGSDAQPRASGNSTNGSGTTGSGGGGNSGNRRNSTSRPNSSRRSSTHQ
ncbi:hypothetical protein IW150_002263 [Coemansia sp. RSA 2607]|nr:hypothetical protein IW150_002263 [Coemansia sp. RSA 2607]